jgi:hypothetical protein
MFRRLELIKYVKYKVFIIILFIIISSSTVVYAGQYKLDKTPENIPKKALIIKHDAKLFKQPYGDSGKNVSFIQLYFLMKPEENSRVPIVKSFRKKITQPDGWLEKESFVEWNTVQMINFEPQKGRKLIKIYNTAPCAQEFSRFGKVISKCEEIGEEPRRYSNNQQYNLLIPVFQSKGDSYHSGFIRINQQISELSPSTNLLGYDLVFVVDSTLSMGKYFAPTMQVLQTFVRYVRNSMKGEISKPLNVGLLFYRDRKKNNDCDIGYTTYWAEPPRLGTKPRPLTSDVNKVIQALNNAQVTHCDSEDDPEAVLDGLHRAILDTKWNSNHYKTIILIGDAPPNFEENPMELSVEHINNLAKQKNIRFLTFKIGNKSYYEFKEIALSTADDRKGRFFIINKTDISLFKKELMNALSNEWDIFMKTLNVMKDSLPSKQSKKHLDITDYAYPIIKRHLSQMEMSLNDNLPDFVKGWAPHTIKGKVAFGEYIFMRKNKLRICINIIDSIIVSSEDGVIEGAEFFLDTVRYALAEQLRMRKEDVFVRGENLDEVLKKANILPFKTEILSFTSDDVNTWKPIRFERIRDSLTDKLKYLREFYGDPKNLHYFDNIPYLYIPRKYFP